MNILLHITLHEQAIKQLLRNQKYMNYFDFWVGTNFIVNTQYMCPMSEKNHDIHQRSNKVMLWIYIYVYSTV